MDGNAVTFGEEPERNGGVLHKRGGVYAVCGLRRITSKKLER